MFSDVARRSVHLPAFASSSAAASLAYLREQTFPKFIDPPRFVPRTRSLPVQPDWVTQGLRRLGRQALAAALFAATAVLIATSLPAWSSLVSGGATVPAGALVRSSSGETGSAASRLEAFGPHNFFTQNPFVQRARLFNDADGTPSPYLFLAGVRQASIAEFANSLVLQAGVPFEEAALATQQSLDAWNAAVAEEVLRQEAASVAPPTFAAPPSSAIWESNLTPGTVIPSVTVTFYACVGNGFCGNMASGHQVFPGAAACSIDMAFGTKFVVLNDPTQTVFTCLDRGALASPWVDVWFYSVEQGHAWQASVGSVSDIRIVE